MFYPNKNPTKKYSLLYGKCVSQKKKINKPTEFYFCIKILKKYDAISKISISY